MTVAETIPFDRRAIPAGLCFGDWIAPDGWVHRRYRWPARDGGGGVARGSLVFVGGRADFAEKYLEAMAHWHDRGWAIDGFDWRGQGGSGRIVAGLDLGHLTSFQPLVDDLAAFVADWRARTAGPHVLVGHSMGGHLILRALAEGAAAADAAVLVAPMLGLPLARAGRLLAFLAGLFGGTMAPLWRKADPGMRRRALTGSADRFADSAWWKDRHPALGLGGPSWGWLHAAHDSLARLRRPGTPEAVGTPILIAAARRDRLVPIAAIRRMAARLPDAAMFVTGGAHELLREADAVRLPVLAAIDRFLDLRAPPA